MLRIHGDSGKSRILLDIYGNNEDSFVVQYVENPVYALPQDTYIVNLKDVDGNNLFSFIKEEIDDIRIRDVDYLPSYIIIYSNLNENDNNFGDIVESLIWLESHGYCMQSIFMYQ